MSKHTTHDTSSEIPHGYCHCGCGEKTKISRVTSKRNGWIKGQPLRFIHGHNERGASHSGDRTHLADRFWKYLTPGRFDECWLWQGFTNDDRGGYGALTVNGKPRGAHRISWELHFGPIPDGLHCLHHCDRPACCNPYHLFLGNAADNMQDMAAKGRGATPKYKGESHPGHKLNEKQVLEIRAQYANGSDTPTELARRYDVSVPTIWAIVYRKLWTHI